MMGLVEGRSSEAGQQPVHWPGEVVTRVVLHSQPDVEQMEQDLAQGVAAHQPGAEDSQRLLKQQLFDAGVLGCQREGFPIYVVRVMELLVQPWVSEKQTPEQV